MIISEEQARLAFQYIESPPESTGIHRPDVSSELMERILLAIDEVPETRPDRVVRARERLEMGVFGNDEVAQMIIARAICDALR